MIIIFSLLNRSLADKILRLEKVLKYVYVGAQLGGVEAFPALGICALKTQGLVTVNPRNLEKSNYF